MSYELVGKGSCGHEPWLGDQKIDYIHDNPVEAGLVNDPECWNYSSANEMSPLKVLVA